MKVFVHQVGLMHHIVHPKKISCWRDTSIGHGLQAIAKALDRTNNLASKKVEIMKNIYEELEKMGVPDDRILDTYFPWHKQKSGEAFFGSSSSCLSKIVGENDE